MKWTVKNCSPADMIRVQLGTVYHYGIYISDDEIIQFGLPPVEFGKVYDEKIEVLSTNKKIFCLGKNIEVAEYDKKEKHLKNRSKKIIANAKNSLGQTGYNLLRNNCKHFSYRCVFDNRLQIPEDVMREQWKNRPRLDVYFSQIPEQVSFENIYPTERNLEITNTTNLEIKKEKYWAWKTLEYAVLRSFAISIEELNPCKLPNGKWISDKCYFSISHSDGLVAVAVSTDVVEIDIENKNNFIKKFDGKEKELNKIFGTKKVYSLDELIKIWTQKEATFKASKSKIFVPKKIKPKFSETKYYEKDDNAYYYTVCSRLKDNMKIYSFEDNKTGQNK